MRATRTQMLCAGIMMLCAGSADADWFPGDPYKMHFPQLPDPMGFDVAATAPQVLADDWQCTATGPVTDVHLWGSWMGGIPGQISSIHVSIHENVPAGVDADFSHPGLPLWERDFFPGQYVVLDPYGTGDEGWFDPSSGVFTLHDHSTYNQINITNIPDAFVQTEGTIYWLDISVTVEPPVGAPAVWGWKSSLNHFMDDAVYRNMIIGRGDGGIPVDWNELTDPTTGQSMDLAFVITPSPGAWVVLGIGGLIGARRRRR